MDKPVDSNFTTQFPELVRSIFGTSPKFSSSLSIDDFIAEQAPKNKDKKKTLEFFDPTTSRVPLKYTPHKEINDEEENIDDVQNERLDKLDERVKAIEAKLNSPQQNKTNNRKRK